MSEANKDVFRGVILWSVLTLGGYLLFRYDMLWLTCLLWASFFDSVLDILDFHFTESYFNKLNPKFWNPEISWQNKWKDLGTGKEKFLGSSTIFVFVTDAWHLAKFLMIKCIVFAVITYHVIFNWWADGLIALSAWGIIFSVFYFLYKRGK